MVQVGCGRIEGGAIVFAEPLALPEGTKVEVRIEPVAAPSAPAPDAATDVEEFLRLPVFGMWRDREDMADGAAWVRGEREKWQQRVARRD
jgi:hypothetical protein